MEVELITVLIATVTGFASTLYKGHIDKKASYKELSKRDLIITDSLKGLGTKVVNLGIQFEGLAVEFSDFRKTSEFDKVLVNSIRAKATQIVTLNYNINSSYKNIIMFVAKQTEDVALRFYYSAYRNAPDEADKYIRADIEEKRAAARNFIESICCDIKIYKKKNYTLGQFLQEINVFKRVELLIMRLVENNLSPQDVIDLFVKFTEQYSEDIIKAGIIFDNLESNG